MARTPSTSTSALSITGVTAATLSLSLVQPPQVAYGPVGSSTSASPCPVTAPATSTCATTAQVSSDLQLTVVGPGARHPAVRRRRVRPP